jgi:hypothetical protein
VVTIKTFDMIIKKAEIYSGVIFILLTAINNAVNAIDFRW